MSKTTLFIFATLALFGALGSGCTPLIIGSATTGVAVVHDRRSTGTIVDDQEIELKALKIINESSSIKDRSNISVTSYNLAVLLTGQAESRAPVQQLIEKLRRLPRVRVIHDKVTIGAESSFTESTSDVYLTSRAKLSLFNLGLKDFDPTRVKIVTSQGVVYLMGLVTQREADAVTDKIRFISGVKRVVKVFEYI